MAVESLEQLERNTSASFGYVKKDILMLNDAISDLNDKIQHLSLNHAALLDKLDKLSEKKEVKIIPKKEVVEKINKETKPVLEFYDLRTKKKFKSTDYVFRNKSARKFAVAKAPSGIESWRIVGLVDSAKKTKISKKAIPKTTIKKKTSEKKTPKRIVKETIEY